MVHAGKEGRQRPANPLSACISGVAASVLVKWSSLGIYCFGQVPASYLNFGDFPNLLYSFVFQASAPEDSKRNSMSLFGVPLLLTPNKELLIPRASFEELRFS